ncbi:MAG TPA: glycoside hydrolase family 1 protein [Candidatus Limnocylindrales bacterium]|nr:glycoside hydrolase family 1 protein [Candidatus Limnocylindrales bacterium]
MKAYNKKLFPKNFLWGASSSSHQVEGGTVNDWSVWELAHASDLAKHAHTRLSSAVYHHLTKLPIWDDIKDKAADPKNYVSGQGVDHYRRYKEDIALAASLNLNALRFSLEWSRIEPVEGEWDQEAIDHYHDYITELKKRGITPMLNIWHWTMPIWFAEKGGLKRRRNLKYFYRFVQKIADEYGHEVGYIVTLNEPNVYTTLSYLTGEWPPQEKSGLAFMRVYWNLTRVHRQSYRILKRANPHLQIGIAAQLANIASKRPHNLMDVIQTEWMRYFWNWWFIRRTRKEQDFVGFNYYFTDYYRFGKFDGPDDPPLPYSDLGWYLEPEGLYPLLLRVWDHYKIPIIITENGLADQNDAYRQWWLEQSILAMEKALGEGVDLRGYFHWSLLDNFEWSTGWWPKFGLIGVDREHGMKRTVRPSAKWLAEQLADKNTP